MLGDDEKFIKTFAPTLAKSKGWHISDIVLLEVFNFIRLDIYVDINFENDSKNIATFTLDNIFPDNIKIIA